MICLNLIILQGNCTMTYTLSVEEAKQKLEEIIHLLNDNDVILTSNGVPAARILPITFPTVTNSDETNLSRTEELHLETEFENYENLYPKIS